MDKRLSWFMNAPGHRSPTATTTSIDVSGGESSRSTTRSPSSVSRVGTLRVCPTSYSQRDFFKPVYVDALKNLRTPVLPVARKTASNGPLNCDHVPPLGVGEKPPSANMFKKVSMICRLNSSFNLIVNIRTPSMRKIPSLRQF